MLSWCVCVCVEQMFLHGITSYAHTHIPQSAVYQILSTTIGLELLTLLANNTELQQQQITVKTGEI